MIASLTGTVESQRKNEIVLLVGGIGFRIICSMNTLSKLSHNHDEVTVFTKMNVREDAMELYGFASYDEKSLFVLLTSVNGVGPRTAIGILGTMPIKDLKIAIVMSDVSALSRAPGIGKKTAQRIALELKEKISDEILTADDYDSNVDFIPDNDSRDARSEAILALKTLGYTQNEISSVMKTVLRDNKGKDLNADELIREVLKTMSTL